jgi:hypothetical protein
MSRNGAGQGAAQSFLDATSFVVWVSLAFLPGTLGSKFGWVVHVSFSLLGCVTRGGHLDCVAIELSSCIASLNASVFVRYTILSFAVGSDVAAMVHLVLQVARCVCAVRGPYSCYLLDMCLGVAREIAARLQVLAATAFVCFFRARRFFTADCVLVLPGFGSLGVTCVRAAQSSIIAACCRICVHRTIHAGTVNCVCIRLRHHGGCRAGHLIAGLLVIATLAVVGSGAKCVRAVQVSRIRFHFHGRCWAIVRGALCFRVAAFALIRCIRAKGVCTIPGVWV